MKYFLSALFLLAATSAQAGGLDDLFKMPMQMMQNNPLSSMMGGL